MRPYSRYNLYLDFEQGEEERVINQGLMLELARVTQWEIERQSAMAVVRHTEQAGESFEPDRTGTLANAWDWLARGVRALVGRHPQLTPFSNR